jgi:glycosyltransferase involved in cell wall biosynthesis
MSGDSRQVAIFFPSGHLELVPSIKTIAIALADYGYKIDLYVAENLHSPKPRIDHANVILNILPWKQRHVYEQVPLLLAVFSIWAFSLCIRKPYLCYIGAGIRGLYTSALLSAFTRVPFIYHSLELYPSWESKSLAQRISKFLERWSNRLASFTIIQDEERACLLAQDNNIPIENIVIIPNAPMGEAEHKRSNYLHKKLSIPENKKIILYAGNIFAPYSMSLELVQAAQYWPEDWVLVLHNNLIVDAEYYIQLQKSDKNGRVMFSRDPVPYEELEDLVSSADIGLALYKPTDANMLHVGLSSGKLMHYLKCGVPVIVNDLPGLKDVVDRYECGLCVQDVREVGNAVKLIFSDYNRYIERALLAFNNSFKAEIYLPHLLTCIRQLEMKRT